jgi:hypothetical protein
MPHGVRAFRGVEREGEKMFNKLDEMVNHWLLSKWLETGEYNYDDHGAISDISVVTSDADWECGCYSSMTRDDDFILTAVIATKSGPVNFRYGRWQDLPSFIEELDEYKNNDACPYERRTGCSCGCHY